MNPDPETTQRHFDIRARDGSAERMEHHHAYPTTVAFDSLDWNPEWRLLDVGCGNGWATRMAAERLYLGRVVGIELAPNMAEQAVNLSAERANIEILCTDLFHAPLEPASFDVVHANESIYYILPIEEAFRKILSLLKPTGTFLCIADYYLENEASHRWKDNIEAPMVLLSEEEYVSGLKRAGFRDARARRIYHPAATETEEESWQQTVGSLLLIARK